ncbi:Gfo/Idh/MocA family oxidoreductase [Cohnella ginsengisoli]|uniref:Gfo/Idh/MocA family oxidoreductase n=1 Tax=Cohnella ginsengisoli TaxID=425004 RepID=A0A9X4KFS3_9BACL|nr:Gfo/Idh/MocA family oxidoreductase [Cohnella ginsengisoli]MDG0791303.1 Gfo/Idh/MocA family oxidoreductase [Cohnella ginsengisoli]
MTTIKVGVIGLGSISDMHLEAYASNPKVRLEAICDLNLERAQAKADKYGVARIYANYNSLLENPDIDAVSICTWNNTHAEISIAAVRAGKHVLVEKPLCKTVEEAHRIQEAVRESGKKLQVGYVRRYDPNARIIHDFIQSGELGDIYYARASCIRRYGNPGGWFADAEKSGGGPLIDIGVHVIDLMWYLMGRPKAVTASANTYRKLGNRANLKYTSGYKASDYNDQINNVEDMANALIRFDNGASLYVDVSFTLHAKQDEMTIKLYGEKGGCELEPATVLVTEKHDVALNMMPQTETPSFHFIKAFQNEIDHFVDCIVDNAVPLSPVEDGVEMMKILCGIYESAALGKEVVL